MKKMNYFNIAMPILIGLSVVACNKSTNNAITPASQNKITDAVMSENGTNPDEAGLVDLSSTVSNQNSGSNGSKSTNAISESRNSDEHHFIYTESNQAVGNEIISYKITRDGSLRFVGTTVSGGNGTGKGLGSEGAIVVDAKHELLFAVNAGSNSVSSFKIDEDGGLALLHTERSGGQLPNSITVSGNLLYVLNTGSDSVQGFRIWEDGSFTGIPGSKHALSGAGVVAPQISFTPDGNWVLVTEKATNNISAFKVKNDGAIWPDVVTASTGQTPFGFAFSRDRFVIVSDAAGGAAGAGATTSYFVGSNGGLHAINGAVANSQAAPCWVAVTQFGRFAYVTNTSSNSISSYYIGEGGRLTLIHEAAASTGNSPADIVVAKNNYNVYELNANGGSIGAYFRTSLGGLAAIGTVTGLPAGVTGLATF